MHSKIHQKCTSEVPDLEGSPWGTQLAFILIGVARLGLFANLSTLFIVFHGSTFLQHCAWDVDKWRWFMIAYWWLAEWYWHVTIVISGIILNSDVPVSATCSGAAFRSWLRLSFSPLLTQDVEPFFTATPCHHSSPRTMTNVGHWTIILVNFTRYWEWPGSNWAISFSHSASQHRVRSPNMCFLIL